MTCSILTARGHTIMKIKDNIRYTVTLKNYKGDRILSPIRSFMPIQCSDKEWDSVTWKGDT